MFPDLMRDDVFRLETPRFWLRWPRAADGAKIAELAGDREVAEMTARIPHPYPAGAAAEFILTSRAGNLAGRQIVLVLTPKHRPDEALGCVSLHETGPRVALLGYWLGKPFWRRGCVTEAACALLDMTLRTTDLDTIVASARPDNAGSRRVLEKLGFSEQGFGIEPAPARGGSLAVQRFQLPRESWTGCGVASGDSRALAGAH